MPVDRKKLKAFVQQTGPRGGLYYLTASGEKKYGAVPSGTQAPAASKPTKSQPSEPAAEKHSIPAEVARRLPATHTPAEHEKIATEFLAKHAASLEASVADMKRLAPEGAKVSGRVKDVASAIEKVARKPKYGTVDKLQDGTGMRVIVSSTDGVEATVANIKKKYRVVAEDDYISKPQEGGYRSHHLIIEGADGLQKEVQVRTQNEHAWAEWAHNSVYKPHTDEQKAALADPAFRDKVTRYAEAMSQHFYDLDRGRGSSASEPQIPPEVERVFGRM